MFPFFKLNDCNLWNVRPEQKLSPDSCLLSRNLRLYLSNTSLIFVIRVDIHQVTSPPWCVWLSQRQTAWLYILEFSVVPPKLVCDQVCLKSLTQRTMSQHSWQFYMWRSAWRGVRAFGALNLLILITVIPRQSYRCSISSSTVREWAHIQKSNIVCALWDSAGRYRSHKRVAETCEPSI